MAHRLSALRDAWVNSLAVAGTSGTLARRMRGTPAARRCHAKTGTLNGVSALSGYCFRGGNDAEHGVIFSVLMNKVATREVVCPSAFDTVTVLLMYGAPCDLFP